MLAEFGSMTTDGPAKTFHSTKNLTSQDCNEDKKVTKKEGIIAQFKNQNVGQPYVGDFTRTHPHTFMSFVTPQKIWKLFF